MPPMGTFFAEALLAAPHRPERREPVPLLVDSGSTYPWIAGARLRSLSVVPTERRRVVTIEGQVAERDAAEVLITLEGRTLPTICLFGDAGDLDVLGAYTLEGFGLGVDPVQRELIPTLQYGAATAMLRGWRRDAAPRSPPACTPSRRGSRPCAHRASAARGRCWDCRARAGSPSPRASAGRSGNRPSAARRDARAADAPR